MNIDFELDKWAERSGHRVAFNKAARKFARDPASSWAANFRDLNASITRMATLSTGGRLTEALVDDELQRLTQNWGATSSSDVDDELRALLGSRFDDLDLFDICQLREVVRLCKKSSSLADAGRKLFARSRLQKANPNDSHRLRQYLAKFGLSFGEIASIRRDGSYVLAVTSQNPKRHRKSLGLPDGP